MIRIAGRLEYERRLALCGLREELRIDALAIAFAILVGDGRVDLCAGRVDEIKLFARLGMRCADLAPQDAEGRCAADLAAHVRFDIEDVIDVDAAGRVGSGARRRDRGDFAPERILEPDGDVHLVAVAQRTVHRSDAAGDRGLERKHSRIDARQILRNVLSDKLERRAHDHLDRRRVDIRALLGDRIGELVEIQN